MVAKTVQVKAPGSQNFLDTKHISPQRGLKDIPKSGSILC
jgi:hypothetical protein